MRNSSPSEIESRAPITRRFQYGIDLLPLGTPNVSKPPEGKEKARFNAEPCLCEHW